MDPNRLWESGLIALNSTDPFCTSAVVPWVLSFLSTPLQSHIRVILGYLVIFSGVCLIPRPLEDSSYTDEGFAALYVAGGHQRAGDEENLCC